MRFAPCLVFAVACLGSQPENVRRPCPDDAAWDPHLPLALRWGDSGLVEMNEHVARRLSLTEAGGAPVEATAFAFPGGLGLCLVGGLKPDTDYAWTVTDGSELAVQEVDVITAVRPGSWLFRTAAQGDARLPERLEDCVNTATEMAIYDEQCPEFLPDTGDSGAVP